MQQINVKNLSFQIHTEYLAITQLQQKENNMFACNYKYIA